MVFEWDIAKDEANRRKHGIGFELASHIFTDPLAVIGEDPGEHGEPRWRIIGNIDGLVLVLVVFTPRGDAVRIVSARRATRNERKNYEAG